jgi:hypothetical protein
MEEANKLIEEANEAIKASDLQEHVDVDFVNNLLLDVRHKQLNGEL